MAADGIFMMQDAVNVAEAERHAAVNPNPFVVHMPKHQ